MCLAVLVFCSDNFWRESKVHLNSCYGKLSKLIEKMSVINFDQLLGFKYHSK